MATSLVAFIALPALAIDTGAPAETHPRSAQLPDERDGQLRLLTLVGPVVAIGVLSILGLTIAVGALRHDMRQQRIVYRPRGP
jgi:hypothetical protein